MAEHPSSLHGFLESDYAVLRNAVPVELLRCVRDAATALRGGAKAPSRQVLYTHGDVPEGAPSLGDLIDQWLNPFRLRGQGSTAEAVDRLRCVVERFFGEEMQIFQDLILLKNKDHGHFPWHQDAAYWPVRYRRGATFWIPLRRVSGNDGGLHIGGDGRTGRAAAVDLHSGRKQDGSGRFGPSRFVAPELSPGDVLVIGPTALHRSGNFVESTAERIAHASIWLDMDARWDHEVAPNHPVCASTEHGQPLSPGLV